MKKIATLMAALMLTGWAAVIPSLPDSSTQCSPQSG